jgi:hypothetical protein
MLFIKSCLNKLYKAEEKFSLIKQVITKTQIYYTYPTTLVECDQSNLFEFIMPDEEHLQFVNMCISVAHTYHFMPSIPCECIAHIKSVIASLYKGAQDLSELANILLYKAGVCGQIITAYDVFAYYQIRTRQLEVSKFPTIARWMKWIDSLLGIE